MFAAAPAAAEGRDTQASPGAAGAQGGKPAPSFATVTAADPAGTAAQRSRTVSPAEGGTGKDSTAEAAIKGHDAAKMGALPSAAPLGARGAAGSREVAAQLSVRLRQEKGGAVVEGEGDLLAVALGVAVGGALGVREPLPVGVAEGVTVGVAVGVTVSVGVGEELIVKALVDVVVTLAGGVTVGVGVKLVSGVTVDVRVKLVGGVFVAEVEPVREGMGEGVGEGSQA